MQVNVHQTKQVQQLWSKPTPVWPRVKNLTQLGIGNCELAEHLVEKYICSEFIEMCSHCGSPFVAILTMTSQSPTRGFHN